MSWGAARSEFLLVVVLLTGCIQTEPVAQWRQPVDPRPQIVTNERAYVEAPTPAKFLEPPLPAVKPDGGTGLAPAHPPMFATASSEKTRKGQAAGTAVQQLALGTAPHVKPPQLIGLTELAAVKLLGQPAETEVASQSRIWIYRSAICTLKLFFYSTDEAPDYRALTYQIEERHPADPDHGDCLAGLVKPPVS